MPKAILYGVYDIHANWVNLFYSTSQLRIGKINDC